MQLRIKIEKYVIDELLEFYNNSKYTQQRKLSVPIPEESKKVLKDLYDSGYGLKVLARELGISYTNIRSLFNYLAIPFRKGRSVTTPVLKTFRSERVQGVLNPWNDWPNKQQGLNPNMGRGIQGYFIDRKGRNIYLRSTWEYIYAKWLDNNLVDWEYEGTQYCLDENTNYRPDFSILKDGKLESIVEIKGFFKNRLYKVDLLREKFGIDVVVIENIEEFTKLGYLKEKKIWKSLVEQK